MSTTHFPKIRILLGTFCICLLASCSVPWQTAPTPTAQQLLTAMRASFRTVKTFHVQLQQDNMGTVHPTDPVINRADSDIVLPDKMKAQVTATISGETVNVSLIALGKDQYFLNSISGQWQHTTGLFDTSVFTRLDTYIVALIAGVHNLSGPDSDSVNGVPCWRLQGQSAAQDLAFLTGGDQFTNYQPQISACIGKADDLPYKITITGQALPTDGTLAVRSFLLSNYNKSVTITAPQVSRVGEKWIRVALL